MYVYARAIKLLSTLDARTRFGHLVALEAEINEIAYIPHLTHVVTISHIEFPDWPVTDALPRLPVEASLILPESPSFAPLLMYSLEEAEAADVLLGNEGFSDDDEKFFPLGDDSAGLDGPTGVFASASSGNRQSLSANALLGNRSRVPSAKLAYSEDVPEANSESSETILDPVSAEINPTPPRSEINSEHGDLAASDAAVEGEVDSEPRQSERNNHSPIRLAISGLTAAMSLAMQSAADDDIAATYKEAMSRPDRSDWEAAIQREVDGLHKNKVLTLVNRSKGRHILCPIGA